MSLPAPEPNAVVLVTGASAGIGTQLARQLAERGYGLALVARRRERLDELAAELRLAHGVEVDVHPADLSDPAARSELISAVRASGRTVVGVCNNAGFGSFGPFQNLPQAREQAMVRLNVDALHELTGAFLADMVGRGAGAILNVGSVAGFQPFPSNATYAATKAFVNSFSEAVHTDLNATGVSCTSLCPGPVKTEFAEAAGIGEVNRLAPDFLLSPPEEVARAGIEGMLAGRRSVIPGWPNKAAAAGGRVAPRSLLLPLARRVVGASQAALTRS